MGILYVHIMYVSAPGGRVSVRQVALSSHRPRCRGRRAQQLRRHPRRAAGRRRHPDRQTSVGAKRHTQSRRHRVPTLMRRCSRRLGLRRRRERLSVRPAVCLSVCLSVRPTRWLCLCLTPDGAPSFSVRAKSAAIWLAGWLAVHLCDRASTSAGPWLAPLCMPV
jgi:hypothetical protein